MTRIIVVTRRGLGVTPIETEVFWPSQWRLPTAGEAITVAPGVGGHIEYVSWDLEQGAVRVLLR